MYKDVKEFINKICVCDKDPMQTKYIIAYEYIVQEAMCECRDLVYSKWLDPDYNM